MSHYLTSRRPARALPIVIASIIALSLLPASWLGWTADLSDLVRVPVTPLSHVGIMVTGWVRPSIQPSDLPTDERDRNELAIAEREHYRQLYHAQLLRATELADELRTIQQLPESALRNPTPPTIVSVDITGLKPNDPSGEVELKLSSGIEGRILEGDLAIVGRDIVGRISNVGMTRIRLQPTVNENMGYIQASIVPAHPNTGRPPLLATVLVQPKGSQYLYAECPASNGVEVGDLLVLDDVSWPPIAKGLIVGQVFETDQLDEAPLRQSLLIRPRFLVRDVARVVILGSGEEERQ